MNAIQFQTAKLADITPAQLTVLVNAPNPAYLAFIDGEAVYLTADGEATDGTTGDESGLPADRLAIRKIVVYAKSDGKGTKVPVVFSYRIIGEVDETTAFRLAGQVSAKLVENANTTGKSMLQTKIDVEQSPDTKIVVYRKNGGEAFKVELAAKYFGLDELTAIDAAMGGDTSKHQLAIAGNKDGNPIVARFSPHTGEEIGSVSRMQLPKGSTNVKSVVIDRETLQLTALVTIGNDTKGFTSESGVSDITQISALDGAESIRMKSTGLYAFNAKGETVYFQRKSDDKIDLTDGNIVLTGVDANIFRLHDVKIEDDGVTGRTKRTATFTGRSQSTSGSRTWTTQPLAA